VAREVWFQRVLGQGRALGEANRYDELLELVEHLREQALSPEEGAVVEQNYAWTLLHVDRADEALVIATELLAQADEEAKTAPMRAVNVYGMALVAAGEAAAAIDVLTDVVARAIAREGDDWVVSAHFLFRGDAFAQLDRIDEARDAWRAATRAHPAGIYGQQAVERLQERPGEGPYRRRR
jgi:tetratricopeptide (TPR) repeat protein